MYVCLCMHKNMYVCLCMSVWMCLYLYVLVSLQMCVHVFVHVYICGMPNIKFVSLAYMYNTRSEKCESGTISVFMCVCVHLSVCTCIVCVVC